MVNRFDWLDTIKDIVFNTTIRYYIPSGITFLGIAAIIQSKELAFGVFLSIFVLSFHVYLSKEISDIFKYTDGSSVIKCGKFNNEELSIAGVDILIAAPTFALFEYATFLPFVYMVGAMLGLVWLDFFYEIHEGVGHLDKWWGLLLTISLIIVVLSSIIDIPYENELVIASMVFIAISLLIFVYILFSFIFLVMVPIGLALFPFLLSPVPVVLRIWMAAGLCTILIIISYSKYIQNNRSLRELFKLDKYI